jgi:VanZ family protein
MVVRQERVWAWVYVGSWMTVIFTLSSIPDLRSGLLPLWDLILRKIAHVAEFAVLGWLMFRAFKVGGLTRIRAAVLAAVISAFFAGTDEWHQSFVTGRNGSPLDVLIDSVGVISGIAARLRLARPLYRS